MDRITIRISHFLAKKINELAKEQNISKSKVIKNLLKTQINEKTK